ncbi:MAG: hydrolase [Clostridia bacterium]|nr:hydrolase [Clostridia bacterium]
MRSNYKRKAETINIFRCPCCGHKTLRYGRSRYPELCPVCFWVNESDCQSKQTQRFNKVSLETAKKNYTSYGAVSREYIPYVRPPAIEEIV